MKMAVLIPSWIEHLDTLPFVLESIEKQTRKPDIVILVISSIPSDRVISFSGYSFPLHVEKTELQQSAAQNRNRGIFLAKDHFDILSFFDSDDFMHPQRLEFIEKAFLENRYDAIVHTYIEGTNQNRKEWVLYDSFLCIDYKVRKNEKVANGHISIRSSITNDVLFPMDKLTIGKEDTLFIQYIEEAGFEIGIIKNEISFYTQCSAEERIDKDYHLFMMRGGVL